MKRFAVSVLAVSAFFVGLGSLAEHVGAKFKSDEKALEIIRKARTAIGGDAALAEVRGLVITGRTTHQIKVNGAERPEQGETEIALQFPDKLMRTVKIGRDDGTSAKAISEHHDVLVLTKEGRANVEARPLANGEIITADGKKIIVKELARDGEAPAADGEKKVFIRKSGDGQGHEFRIVDDEKTKEVRDVVLERSAAPHAGMAMKRGIKQNEMLRHTLALLLTAPEGMDVSYTFAGETDIDGVGVNVVNAEFGGANYKLYIGKSNNLPVAMGYVGFPAPTMIRFSKMNPEPADAPRAAVAFTKTIDTVPTVEHLVKFSDYRSTGNVQLPYKWTTSIAGETREVFEVTSYDVNPANLAERFQGQRTFIRMKKPDGQ